MRNTLAAIADFCEADEAVFPGNIAKLLRGILADAQAAQERQDGRSSPPASDDPSETLRLRTALLEAETALARVSAELSDIAVIILPVVSHEEDGTVAYRVSRVADMLLAARDEQERLRGELRKAFEGQERRDESASWYRTKIVENDTAIRAVIPDRFLLDPPDGGDVKTHEAVARMADALAIAAGQIARKDAVLADLNRDLNAAQQRADKIGEDRAALKDQVDRLLAELDGLRAETHALRQAPVPATEEALITLEQAIAEGSDQIPADDESADMGGSQEPEPEPVAGAQAEKRLPAPRQPVEISPGVFVPLTWAKQKLVTHLQTKGNTAASLIEAGVYPNALTATPAIADLKREIRKQTNNAWTIMAINGGYHIVCAGTPTGESQPSVQSAGDAGASPDKEAADVGAPVSAGSFTPQVVPCVTPSGAGEGADTPVDPVPAVERVTPKIGDGPIEIPPGQLIAVDVKARRIATPKGVYRVDGTPLAKALACLAKAPDGAMFDVQTLARVGGYKDADAARTAIRFEEARLLKHGVAVAWLGRDNLRLTAAG